MTRKQRKLGYPVEVYCDESLKRGGYDILGGLWLTRPHALRLRKKIQLVRDRNRYPHEFKWKKCGGSSMNPAYRDLVDMVGQQLAGGSGGFHCIAVRKELVDLRKYHEGDHELGFYKFMTLLFRKRIEPGQRYIFTVDRRTTRTGTRLADVHKMLNVCGRKDHGIGYDCCREVRSRDSGEEELLQVADVLVGAVGFHLAGDHLASNASIGKCQTADRLLRWLPGRRPLLSTPTGKNDHCFNVWVWRPEKN